MRGQPPAMARVRAGLAAPPKENFGVKIAAWGCPIGKFLWNLAFSDWKRLTAYAEVCLLYFCYFRILSYYICKHKTAW
jgi:hypothetical protein